jgi:hypothetical protein
MKKLVLTLILGLGITMTYAQEAQKTEEFKPSGKMNGLIYTNFNTYLEGPKTNDGFAMERAYLGYNYMMSPEFSAKILLDIGSNAELGRYAFFKNAALFYNKNQWTVGFGIQGTFNMGLQEKFWDKRYIVKPFNDEQKYAHTADLGMSVVYNTNYVSFDFSMMNGEGFRNLQNDETYRTGLGATARLADRKIILRAYSDIENKGPGTQTTTLFAGFNNKTFNIGGEYNMQKNSNFTKDADRDGFSFYGNYFATEKIGVFARMDIIQSNYNHNQDGTFYVVGGEYKLIKNLRASLNYQMFQPDAMSADNTGQLFLSLEAAF